jgi:Ca-activated chloride channel family protein
MTARSPAPTVTLAADRTLVRQAGGSTRYLRIRVVAPPHTAGAVRPPVHVAFSLDRSGSMAGGKLELAKQAVTEALGFLGRDDRFAVVTFDDRIDVVAPSRAATADAVREARTELARVDARGSTALCQGWLTACAEIG